MPVRDVGVQLDKSPVDTSDGQTRDRNMQSCGNNTDIPFPRGTNVNIANNSGSTQIGGENTIVNIHYHNCSFSYSNCQINQNLPTCENNHGYVRQQITIPQPLEVPANNLDHYRTSGQQAQQNDVSVNTTDQQGRPKEDEPKITNSLPQPENVQSDDPGYAVTVSSTEDETTKKGAMTMDDATVEAESQLRVTCRKSRSWFSFLVNIWQKSDEENEMPTSYAEVLDSVSITDRWNQELTLGDIFRVESPYTTLAIYVGDEYIIRCDKVTGKVMKQKLELTKTFEKRSVISGRCRNYSPFKRVKRAEDWVGRTFSAIQGGWWRCHDFPVWVVTGLGCNQAKDMGFALWH